MPGFQYWFSGAALWLAGSFIIAVVLGVIGIRTMISDKMVFFLIGIAILVLFIGWWTAAEQEDASAKRELKFDAMHQTLEQIRESLPMPEVDPAVENISQLSNNEIRKRASNLAAQMRTFEGGLKGARMADMGDRLPPDATQEQRHAAWQAQTARMLTRSAESQTQFRIQFLPQALALREVISNRLGIMAPYPSDRRAIALEYHCCPAILLGGFGNILMGINKMDF